MDLNPASDDGSEEGAAMAIVAAASAAELATATSESQPSTVACRCRQRMRREYAAPRTAFRLDTKGDGHVCALRAVIEPEGS